MEDIGLQRDESESREGEEEDQIKRVRKRKISGRLLFLARRLFKLDRKYKRQLTNKYNTDRQDKKQAVESRRHDILLIEILAAVGAVASARRHRLCVGVLSSGDDVSISRLGKK